MIYFFGLHILVCLRLVRWHVHLKNTGLNSSLENMSQVSGEHLEYTNLCRGRGSGCGHKLFQASIALHHSILQPRSAPALFLHLSLHPSHSTCGGMSLLTFPLWGGRGQEGRRAEISLTHREGEGTGVSLLMSSGCHFSCDSVISWGDGWDVHHSLQCCNSQPTFTCGCSERVQPSLWPPLRELSPPSATSVLA